MDVSSGDAAAGPCIDFYGRFQAGAIGAGGDANRVGYIDPVRDGKSMTSTTADPVTLLRGAPSHELAEQFIAWLLSRESQQLWQAKADSPGGTERYELRRMPIRSDLYQPQYTQHWTDPQVNPFETASPLPEATPSYFSTVAPVSHAMAIDVHDDLKAAWKAIQRTPDSHPDMPRMLELFDAMPERLTLAWPDEELARNWAKVIDDPSHPRYAEVEKVLADFASRFDREWQGSDQRLKDQLAWTLFFRENYREIVEMAP
jgi:hypothetical protein